MRILAFLLLASCGCAGVQIKDEDPIGPEDLRVCKAKGPEHPNELRCISLEHFVYLVRQHEQDDSL